MAGVQIDWGLLGHPVDIGAAFTAGLDRGRALGERRATQGALGALARDPTNVDALATVTSLAPEEAYRFQAARRAQADYDRGDRFRGALASYMTGGTPAQLNALSGAAANPSATIPAANALGSPQVISDPSQPARGGREPGEAVGNSSVSPRAGTLDALAPAPQGDSQEAVVVVANRPRPLPRVPVSPNGNGWDAVIRADPEKAMVSAHAMFGGREDELKDWQHVPTAGMRLLAGVNDQDSYDRAKATASHLYDSFGVPFPEVPDEYSPETVRNFQMGQLDIEKQVHAALQERKFEWQQEDGQLDNARADRNVDSEISHRSNMEGIAVRGQNVASADRRYGVGVTDARDRYSIGVAHDDRVRGQDLEHTDRVRGQDMGGRRRFRSQAPATPQAGASAQAPVKVTTPDQARNLPKGTYFQTPDGRVKVR